MSPELLFTISTYSVLPAWILLAVAPGWRWSQLAALTTSLAIAVEYSILVPLFLWEGEGDMGSLVGVMRSFDSPHIVLIGWIHYLAFDLFIGAWQARDAVRLGIPRVLLIPCLALTLLLGPIGLLLYVTMRTVKLRQLGVDEGMPALSSTSESPANPRQTEPA